MKYDDDTMERFYKDSDRRIALLTEKAISNIGQLYNSINRKIGMGLHWSHELKKADSFQTRLYVESEEIRSPLISAAWDSFKVGTVASFEWIEKERDRDGNMDFSRRAPDVGINLYLAFRNRQRESIYLYIDDKSVEEYSLICKAHYRESTGRWEVLFL